MKRLLFAVVLCASSAYADDYCSGRAQVYASKREARAAKRYCAKFSIRFPWKNCITKMCWSGSKVPPLLASGVACGTRVFCVRVGYSTRYRCRF